jgi:photosystem II stability/assembly factor-like uncharacterized protein
MRSLPRIPVIWPAVLLVATVEVRAQVVTPRPITGAVPGDVSLQVDPAAWSALRYRYIGPPGNRVIAIAGLPGDPSVYYVGAASGGIWKTIDGGVHWLPIFDDQPVSSIGALAVAPSDPAIVWAGTGETFLRSHISMGYGVFKSTDEGKSWRCMGLEKTGRIGRIVIDPRDPEVVLVAALGHVYGPQPERGVYRTTDGGRSWTRVLFVDEDTGAVDLVTRPDDPDIIFAATWQIEVHTWGRTSGGPGSGIWRSRDGGATWKRLSGHGLPTRPFGKVGLAVTPAAPDRIYALIETGRGVPWQGEPTDDGALWRSDDGGENWQLVNSNSGTIIGRPAYYTRMGVSSDDPDEAYFLSIGFSSTTDGGRTLDRRPSGSSPGFDNHDIWIDPIDGDRITVANDEGFSISTTRGRTWNRIRLPVAQMYRVRTDNRVPYLVYGNMQDGPSTVGPSNSKFGGASFTGSADIPRGLWFSVGGGESGCATPDPVDPDIVWSTASGRGAAGGIVVRTDFRTRQSRDVEVWPVATFGHPAAEVTYRFIWDFPITISPNDHNRVYVGSQFVHVTEDGGRSWRVISPDLTLNDRRRQGISGGLTPDNLGVEYGNIIYAIAESPMEPGLIWVGTNDGLVQLTRDGGRSWTNVTRNIPGLPPWGTINNIEPSRFQAGTAYLTVNGHQEGNFDPWVYRTRDYGRSWDLIVDGIPKSPLSFAHCVREDPVRPGLLYLGTENALYISFNDGRLWQPLQMNLPPAPVSWLTIQEHFNDLVLSTYGRGFWILDDLSPFQQLTNEVAASTAFLFRPHPAYRFRMLGDGIRESSDDPTAGSNPEYGASLNYWLSHVPEGEVSLVIRDASGRTVRTIPGTKTPGINRVHWDLSCGPSGASARRGGGSGGAPGGSFRLLAPPGRYTVTLQAGDRVSAQSLTVLKDPDSGGSLEQIAVQTAMLERLSTDIDSALVLTEGIERIRSGLRELNTRIAGDPAMAEVRGGAQALERRFTALADSLNQQKPGAFYMWPVRLNAKLVYLANHLQSSDYAPTDQARAAQALLRAQLQRVGAAYQDLLRRDLAAFNGLLQRRGLAVILPQPW